MAALPMSERRPLLQTLAKSAHIDSWRPTRLQRESIAGQGCGQSQWPNNKRFLKPTSWAYCSILLLSLLLAVLFTSNCLLRDRSLQDLTASLGPLRFTKDGTFQLSIFEDLHFGENAWEQWGPEQDYWSTQVMHKVLDEESPQLVVLNGDLITGENTYLENSTMYIDQIVAPMIERNLPWASTYGNHDSEFNLSRKDILAWERRHRNALTTQMVFSEDAGVSNYYLPVYPSNGSMVPALLLWFFDSRGGHYFQQQTESGERIRQPDWVDQSVVDWFLEVNDELAITYGKEIPSLGFVHIPANASRALQTEAGIDPHQQPGINDDRSLARQGQGWCSDGSDDEHCRYGGQDVPFMEAVVSSSMIALFSGHDHGDTWCYKWDTLLPGMSIKGNGINLCFGQHSGYGGYGSWTRGSRQVLIMENMLQDRELETWIRLENGEVVGSVMLNATYGDDRYPATDNTHTHCPTCE